jgi:hypothetical protein
MFCSSEREEPGVRGQLGFILSIRAWTVVGMGTIQDCTGLDRHDFIDPGA